VAGPWSVAGTAENAALADTMAGLVRAEDASKDVRALSQPMLFRAISGAEREQVLELLDTRTTADIARAQALRAAALELLADSGPDVAEAPLTRSRSEADDHGERPPVAEHVEGAAAPGPKR